MGSLKDGGDVGVGSNIVHGLKEADVPLLGGFEELEGSILWVDLGVGVGLGVGSDVRIGIEIRMGIGMGIRLGIGRESGFEIGIPQVDRKAQTRPVAVSAEVEGCSWGRHRDIQDGVTASDLDPGSDQRVENLTMGSDRMMRRVGSDRFDTRGESDVSNGDDYHSRDEGRNSLSVSRLNFFST